MPGLIRRRDKEKKEDANKNDNKILEKIVKVPYYSKDIKPFMEVIETIIGSLHGNQTIFDIIESVQRIDEKGFDEYVTDEYNFGCEECDYYIERN